MNIHGIARLAQGLEQLGANHLEASSSDNITAVTSSLGGRLARWLRLSANQRGEHNQQVIRNLVNQIRASPDLGPRFAEIAEAKFAGTGSRSLSGRAAAQVLRDVVRVKTAEDTVRVETYQINAKALIEHFRQTGQWEKSIGKAMEGVGMAHSPLTRAQREGLEEGLRQVFSARSLAQGKSLDPAQALPLLEEQCQRTATFAREGHIRAVGDALTTPGALHKLAMEKAVAMGVDASLLPADTGNVLADHIRQALDERYAKAEGPPPAMEQGRQVAQECVNNFLSAFDKLNAAQLDMEGQEAVQQVLFQGVDMPAPEVAAGTAALLPQAVNMLNLLLSPNAELVDLQIAYARACRTLEGTSAENAAKICELAGRAACLMQGVEIPSDTGRQSFSSLHELMGQRNSRAYEAFSSIQRGGAPIHQIRYAESHSGEPARGALCENFFRALLGPLHAAAQNNQQPEKLGMPGLGQMSLAQAREFFPEGHSLGQISLEGEFNKEEALRDINAVDKRSNIAPNAATELSAGATAELLGLYSSFNDQFILDFTRNGITINGEHIKGDNEDKQNQANALKLLITHFPNATTAGKVCNALHQGLAADALSALMHSPATRGAFIDLQTTMKTSVNNQHAVSVNSNADGSWTAISDVGIQKASLTETMGLNVQTNYHIALHNDSVNITATDYDFIFNRVNAS